MAKKTIAELKAAFNTGQIPDGQDFADFLDTTFPDPLTQYEMIELIEPTEPHTAYPEGTSAFVATFIRAEMPEWAEAFDNESIPDGDMMVVTHKNSETGFCLQEVDTYKDGIFMASYSRSTNADGNWTALHGVFEVKSVNGSFADETGNIVIDSGGGTDPTSIIEQDTSTATNKVPSSKLFHDSMSDIYNSMYQHNIIRATTTELGHVMIDGTTIVLDENGVISAVGGSGDILIPNSYSYDIGKLPDEYTSIITCEVFLTSTGDDNYNDFVSLFANYLSATLSGVSMNAHVFTEKMSYKDYTQKVYFVCNYNDGVTRYKVGAILSRPGYHSGNSSHWGPWQFELPANYGIGNPENIVPSFNTAKYIDTMTGTEYIRKAPDTGFESSNWVPVVDPTTFIANSLERTTEGAALDARAGAYLHTMITDHETLDAKDENLPGHVFVDGVTIVQDENYVISAPQINTFRNSFIIDESNEYIFHARLHNGFTMLVFIDGLLQLNTDYVFDYQPNFGNGTIWLNISKINMPALGSSLDVVVISYGE